LLDKQPTRSSIGEMISWPANIHSCLLDTRIWNIIFVRQLTRSLLVLSLFLELIEDLLLVNIRFGEVEGDLVGGKLLVGVLEGGGFVLHHFLIKGVEVDSLVVSSIKSASNATSDNGGGSDDIVKDGEVDGLESSGSGSHLRGVVDGSLGDDGAVSNKDARAVSDGFAVFDNSGSDLDEFLEGSVGDTDESVGSHGSVFSLVFNSLGGVDEDTLEGDFSLGFEGGELLGDFFIEVSWLFVLLLQNFAFVEHLCCYLIM
jgi:hypothetical protein